MSKFNVTPDCNILDNPTELDGSELIEAQQGINGVKIPLAAVTPLEMAAPVDAVASAAKLTSSGEMAPATHAVSVLTSDATNVLEGETVRIGEIIYTFRATTVAAYDINIGVSAAESLDFLKAAINASGTGDGSDYHEGTAAHPYVVATTNTDTTQEIQAKIPGLAANSLVTTETSTHLSWADTTLGGGTGASVAGVTTAAALLTIGTRTYTFVDELSETAADAIVDQILYGANAAAALTNLKLAIDNGATEGVNYSTGTVVNADVVGGTLTATTLVITAKIAGVIGDLIACVTTGANFAFDDVTLGTEVAGVDGTPGVKGQMGYDTGFLYICTDINTTADDSSNWLKTALIAI